MTEIVVLSGKGGTGKSTVTASFAHLAKNAVICDFDVDAPDLHIVLDPQVQHREDFISGNEAVIDAERCVQCGTCESLCRFGAIHSVDGQPVVDSLRCEGCGACYALCPAKAINFPDKNCGEWFISTSRFGTFVHALLEPGEENSGRLVSLLKEKAREIAKRDGNDLILCDGSPGVGCPVISALSGSQIAVLVVEPTPSGRHDFERIAALCKRFRVRVTVVINKADLNPQEADDLAAFAEAEGHTVLGRLPFDPSVIHAMMQRKSLTESDSPLAGELRAMWAKLQDLAAQCPKK